MKYTAATMEDKNVDNKKDVSATPLPIVQCDGCGVCCFHMGYPAFVLPRDPVSESALAEMEIESGQPFSDSARADLLAGRDGESHWHQLPEDLKQQWRQHVAQYRPPEYGDTLDTFDGPCSWLDLETRMCKHHQYRPNVCRDFETGNPQCLQWRDVYRDRILK
jgi:Fe-S-cluster containining protein